MNMSWWIFVFWCVFSSPCGAWPCHLQPAPNSSDLVLVLQEQDQADIITCGEEDPKKPNDSSDKSLAGFCVDFQMTIICFLLRTSVLFLWCTAQFRPLHADWCLPETETRAMRRSSLRLCDERKNKSETVSLWHAAGWCFSQDKKGLLWNWWHCCKWWVVCSNGVTPALQNEKLPRGFLEDGEHAADKLMSAVYMWSCE